MPVGKAWKGGLKKISLYVDVCSGNALRKAATGRSREVNTRWADEDVGQLHGSRNIYKRMEASSLTTWRYGVL